MDMPMPGNDPQTCPTCAGAKVEPNPERVASVAFWAEHALSAG
jgi:hypothetical protein